LIASASIAIITNAMASRKLRRGERAGDRDVVVEALLVVFNDVDMAYQIPIYMNKNLDFSAPCEAFLIGN